MKDDTGEEYTDYPAASKIYFYETKAAADKLKQMQSYEEFLNDTFDKWSFAGMPTLREYWDRFELLFAYGLRVVSKSRFNYKEENMNFSLIVPQGKEDDAEYKTDKDTYNEGFNHNYFHKRDGFFRALKQRHEKYSKDCNEQK